jgi:hypothetical protein
MKSGVEALAPSIAYNPVHDGDKMTLRSGLHISQEVIASAV